MLCVALHCVSVMSVVRRKVRRDVIASCRKLLYSVFMECVEKRGEREGDSCLFRFSEGRGVVYSLWLSHRARRW